MSEAKELNEEYDDNSFDLSAEIEED